MLKFLSRKFIKNYNNYDDNDVRTAYGKLCGIVGIISNIFLCTIKIVTGILIGSIAIIADGINNLSDAGSSIVTLVGFKLANAPADSDHPFGHERIEYISGLIVSFIILVIGVLLMKTSIEKIINPNTELLEFNVKIITIIILVVAILVKCWQSIFYKKAGKLISSTTLIATSSDSLNDCISTGAVLLSLLVTLIFPKIQLDGYMGVVVSIFILISGIGLVKQTISPLIGEAPTKKFMNEVINKILSYDGVLGIHDLVIHSYGPAKTFITAHVEVDSRIDIVVSHDIIDNIEHDFLTEKNLNLVIHMDPIDISNEKTLQIKKDVEKMLYDFDQVLRYHDFRVVHGTTHTNIIFDVVVPVGYKFTNEELKKELSNRLKQIDETYNLVVTIDQDFAGRR